MPIITMMTPNQTNFTLKEDEKYELTTLRTTTITNNDRNFLVPLKPGVQNMPKLSYSEDVGTKNGGIHFTNIMADSLEYLKKMLGLTPDCLNGGMKTLRGECICPKFYRGHLCEELVCVNNGTLVKIPKLFPTQYSCRCPYPEYIHGQHCEHVKCLNGGRPMDNGHCKCLDYWYTGQFCQEYAASWGVVLGLPLLCIVIMIICCVVCRLDLFPRKPTHSRRRRRTPLSTICDEGTTSHRRRGLELNRSSNRTGNEIYLRMQENLLNDNGGESLAARPHNYFLSSYIVHLNSVPVMDPNLTTDANSSKPFDPPPSYEEAVATFSTLQQPPSVGDAAVLPPHYSSYPNQMLPRSQFSNAFRNR